MPQPTCTRSAGLTPACPLRTSSSAAISTPVLRRRVTRRISLSASVLACPGPHRPAGERHGQGRRMTGAGQDGLHPGQPCSRGVQHDYRTKVYGGHLCREVISAVGRAGSRGQLLATACRRRPVGAAPTVHPDARVGAGAGPWTLHVHAWLTLLNQRREVLYERRRSSTCRGS